ncbi:MAG: FAD-dependent oxidoreductase [Clostridia bacterium]|nr:FAD-dependent oxidoreductase [Clostridia bacterium]
MVINENLTTKVLGEYDAVVVGAGPAGCGAALALGRAGMKTLLIEKFNCLGGAWTTGFMNPFFDCHSKTGIVHELVEELKSAGHFGGFWDISFNYEYMKFFLEKKLQEANVEILYNTTFSRTLIDEKRVYGIVAENIEGRFAVLAKTVFDCTGDGNVAASAGCPFELGVDGDYKECQAMTLMFLVGNIPEKYKDGLMIYEKLNAVYEKGGKQIPFRVPYLIPVPNSHFGVIQFTHMYEYDPLNAKALTRATMEGRQQLIDAFEFLTKYDEEFKDLELITSSSVLGVRESRRILGEYRMSTDDILTGASFDDAVAYVTFGADLHTKSNKGQNCFQVQPYQIPLRALIPQGYKGIVVAGRCISGSREAMASYRVTGNCAQMGENAGYYVAEAIKQNVDVLDVKLNLPLIYT